MVEKHFFFVEENGITNSINWRYSLQFKTQFSNLKTISNQNKGTSKSAFVNL
jgi:hypothetical protein